MTYLRLLRGASLVVSFRLHAFLPCLSFGTPTVNISYDERSLSLVRTLGLGEWDIDFIQEPDVTEAVLDRVNRISELPLFVEAARPRWSGLAEAMTAEIAGFAEDVYAYAAESIPART
jgi:polysaccharide pyruvyl transferase WcaK-like protein